MSQPLGPSAALDSIIDQQEQAAWIGLGQDMAEPEISPERIELARRRIQAEPDRLPAPQREHPHTLDALESIAAYVYHVIPSPAETESRGWVLSAWPSTNRTKVHRRFSTLSIQNVELLWFMEDLTDDGEWLQWTMMNVAPTLPITPEIEDIAEEGSYRTVGPVTRLFFDDWNQVEAVLFAPGVLLPPVNSPSASSARAVPCSPASTATPWLMRCSPGSQMSWSCRSLGQLFRPGGAETGDLVHVPGGPHGRPQLHLPLVVSPERSERAIALLHRYYQRDGHPPLHRQCVGRIRSKWNAGRQRERFHLRRRHGDGTAEHSRSITRSPGPARDAARSLVRTFDSLRVRPRLRPYRPCPLW